VGSAQQESQRAELWFMMAKDCPVHVFINVFTLDEVTRDPSEEQPSPQPSLESEHPCLSVIPVLRHHAAKLRKLTLRSSSEALARTLLVLLYPDGSFLHVLHQLTINIVEELAGAPLGSSIATLVFPPLPPPPSPVTPFPEFTALDTLNLTNHILPPLFLLPNIRHIYFKRPLRAPPISISDLFSLLANSSQIATFELECRTLDDQVPLNAEENRDGIVLRSLHRLGLRCNNIEQLLNRLALPVLKSLSIDDLDSHSPNARLGTSLRGLLVRSALVGSGVVVLKHIELTNVGMCPSRRGRVGEDAATWEWCFNRTTLLETIALTSGEGSEHLGLLNFLARGTFNSSPPPDIENSCVYGRGVVCPCLRTLTLSAPFVIDPFAASAFMQVRPCVKLSLKEVANDVIPFATLGRFGLVDPLGPQSKHEERLCRGGFGFGSHFDQRRRPRDDNGTSS